MKNVVGVDPFMSGGRDLSTGGQLRHQAQPPEADPLQLLDLPTPPEATAATRAARSLDDLRSLLLGFDLAPGDATRTLADYQRARAELTETGEPPLHREIEVFSAFADLAELARNRPAAEEGADERVHSPREHFHAYLRSLDADREHLPDGFRRRLARALAHYDVTDLDRGPALEEAVFRIFLAQRTASDLVVIPLLQHWMAEPPPVGEVADLAREVLDRLVLATQLRYPMVGDLARSARFRWFDQPVVDAERQAVLAGVGDELIYLSDNPDAPDYGPRLDALAAIPEQIVGFLAMRIEHALPQREPMLEVLVRRHYREYELHDMRRADRCGQAAGHGGLCRGRTSNPAGHDHRAVVRAGRVLRPGRRDRRPARGGAGRPRGRGRPVPVLARRPGLGRPRCPARCNRY